MFVIVMIHSTKTRHEKTGKMLLGKRNSRLCGFRYYFQYSPIYLWHISHIWRYIYRETLLNYWLLLFIVIIHAWGQKLTICLSFYIPLFPPHCNWHHVGKHKFAYRIQEVINISDRGAYSLSPWQHVIPDTEWNWFEKQINTPEL